MIILSCTIITYFIQFVNYQFCKHFLRFLHSKTPKCLAGINFSTKGCLYPLFARGNIPVFCFVSVLKTVNFIVQDYQTKHKKKKAPKSFLFCFKLIVPSNSLSVARLKLILVDILAKLFESFSYCYLILFRTLLKIFLHLFYIAVNPALL